MGFVTRIPIGYKGIGKFFRFSAEKSGSIISGISISDDGTNIIIDYEVSGTEENQPPVIVGLVRAGTMEADEVQTLTITFENNSIYSVDSVSLKVYFADDINGTNDSLDANVTDFTDNGDGTLTVNYTLDSANEGEYMRASATITLNGGANPTSESYSSIYTLFPVPVQVEDAFTNIAIRYEDMVFAGGDGSDLSSVNNRGDYGTVDVTAFTNAPTLDSGNAMLNHTKADAEALVVPRPENTVGGYTYGFVILIPTNATTRYLSAISGSKNIRFDGSNNIVVNGTTTVALAYDTLVAVRIFVGTTGNSYVQVNKGSKISNAVNDTGVGFTGSVWFGSQHTTTNSLEGKAKFYGFENGAVADEDWDAIVDKYIT